MGKELQVTTIGELTEYAHGQIVELPPFAEGQPFVARMRRPSLLALARSGKIPNTLLDSANTLFYGRKTNEKISDDALEKMLGVIDCLAEAAFIEPSYRELKNAGIELTDDQYMFVFNYTQQGISQLQSFRKKQRNTKNNNDGESVE